MFTLSPLAPRVRSRLAVGRLNLGHIAALLAAVLTAAACDSPTSPTPPPPTPSTVSLASLALQPTVVAGDMARATLTLSGPSATGVVVALSITTNLPTAVAFPATVTIPAGTASATFEVATPPMPPGAPAVEVMVSATAGGRTETARMTVIAQPATLATVALDADEFVGGRLAGGIVTLDGPAPPNGLVVRLSSDNRDVRPQEVVLVPAGETRVLFPVPTSPTPEDVNVVVTATDGTVTRTVTIRLLMPPPSPPPSPPIASGPAPDSAPEPGPDPGPAPTPAPTLTAIAPASGAQGNTTGVTLTGTNFIAGATVAISGADVAVNNVVVNSGTSISAQFVIAGGASTGARTVTVTTANGTSNGITFTISFGGMVGLPQ